MAEQKRPEKLGRYDIIRELGKGAMGIVYEGKDPNIGRRVAIKTARRDVMEATGMADEMMERFLREAQAAGTLNHPNIITIFDADEQDGIAYIAMEFLEGGDLQDLLEKRARLGEKEILEIGATIAEALAAAHDQGIVHRDIKPANIIMPTGKPLKIADFGIAHVSDSNLTQEGALIGTPHYMSPEQFMGQKVDGRSDLFSVAVILYEMLTGEKPFTGEALSTVMHHVIRTDPVPPNELNFSISDATNQVVMKGMSKKPGDRYADGRAFAAALRECIKTKPDPHILATGSPGMEATRIGGTANLAGDATVVAASAPDEATVNLQGPDDRTVFAPAEDQGEETLRQAPAVPGAGATTVKPVPEPQPVDWQRWVKDRRVLAGVAAVVLVAGLISHFSGGGAPEPEGNGNTETVVPPVDEPYFSSVVPVVYGTSDVSAWEAYQGGAKSVEDMTGLWAPIAVDVKIFDYGATPPKLLKEVQGYTTKDGPIDIEGHPKQLSFEFTYKGDKEGHQFKSLATRVDQIASNVSEPFCMLIEE